jgi:hypothetical protein
VTITDGGLESNKPSLDDCSFGVVGKFSDFWTGLWSVTCTEAEMELVRWLQSGQNYFLTVLQSWISHTPQFSRHRKYQVFSYLSVLLIAYFCHSLKFFRV